MDYARAGGKDNISRIINYADNGKVEKDTRYVYREDGSLSARSVKQYDVTEEGSKLINTDSRKYDEAGRMVSYTSIQPEDKTSRQYLYGYDGETRTTTRFTQVNSDGTRTRVDYARAGGKDNISRIRNYDDAGKVEKDTRYTYREDGSLSARSVKQYDVTEEESKLISTDSRTYDEAGRMVSYTLSQPEEKTSRQYLYGYDGETRTTTRFTQVNSDGTRTVTAYLRVAGLNRVKTFTEYGPLGVMIFRKNMTYFDDGSLKSIAVFLPELTPDKKGDTPEFEAAPGSGEVILPDEPFNLQKDIFRQHYLLYKAKLNSGNYLFETFSGVALKKNANVYSGIFDIWNFGEVNGNSMVEPQEVFQDIDIPGGSEDAKDTAHVQDDVLLGGAMFFMILPEEVLGDLKEDNVLYSGKAEVLEDLPLFPEDIFLYEGIGVEDEVYSQSVMRTLDGHVKAVYNISMAAEKSFYKSLFDAESNIEHIPQYHLVLPKKDIPKNINDEDKLDITVDYFLSGNPYARVYTEKIKDLSVVKDLFFKITQESGRSDLIEVGIILKWGGMFGSDKFEEVLYSVESSRKAAKKVAGR